MSGDSSPSTLEVDGLRIAYRREGSGPPLVLLHGGLGDWRDFSIQVASLSDEFDVVAWDAPGCGGSDDPPESWTLDDYGRSLARFMETLGIGPAHVGGVSYGGGLAIQLYAVAPELVSSLVLVSAYAGWGGSLPAEEVEQRLEGTLALFDRPIEELLDAFIPTLFAVEVAIEVVEERVAQVREFHPRGSATMLRGFAAADLRDVLPTIGVPTLVVCGEKDVRAPVGTVGASLHAAIPDSKMIVFPGIGHMVNMEAPAEFAAAVRAFLRAV